MVGTSSGAGAPSLVIKGTIDSTDLERGFARIKIGFDNVKGQAKGFTSDLTRMDIAAKGLAKGLSTIAVVGTTAMVGLAKNAPAVALPTVAGATLALSSDTVTSSSPYTAEA